MNEQPAVLEIENLTVAYREGKGWLDAVRDVSLCIRRGQTYGLVGESGSGKSTLAHAIMGYLSEDGRVRSGSIRLLGRDLLALEADEMSAVWRRQIKLVPQNPLSSLNPSLRVGDQLAETLEASLTRQQKQQRVLDLLDMVRLADPTRVAQSYPHQLSGGMQQRVMIAMALSGEPALLVLDEPTTNLDVTTEATILDLFADLIRERNTAVLYVSHNLGVITNISDRIAVLYASELVEDATVADLYARPLHPYTQGLLDSVPRIGQNKRQLDLLPIPGQIPHLDELPPGCVFAPRCPIALEQCAIERPPIAQPTPERQVRCHRWQDILSGEASLATRQAALAPGAVTTAGAGIVLKATGVYKRFPVRRSLAEILRRQSPRQIQAVDGVDVQIRRGETLGLVGESGSGKTTLARAIIGLYERSDGQITLLDAPLAPKLSDRELETVRRLQMVFQNPEDALNPYRTVGQSLRRPLMRLGGYSRQQADEQVARLLAAVKLNPSYAERRPDQLSGGEKQRVAIARAFAAHPDLLIFDESVSALDVSVQASILNLLNELQLENQSSYLFISHDLSVVGYLADEVAVMYLGQVMEYGPSETIFTPPYHPYTEALLSAIPILDPAAEQQRIRLEGEIPSPIDVPSGCRFHTRCHRMLGDICVEEAPPWQELDNGCRIRCHIPLAELTATQTPVVVLSQPPTRNESNSS